ncbi:MAG: MarR family winged helix-turn-helix transcriptional regulator [Burkholderiaceae bacterium]|nr:MarR family winged helix-turn-helix transcriptional regulator [Burkholderiaceae bacterium]
MNPTQETLGFLVAGVARQMRRAFQRRLTDPLLTLSQARALVYVSRHEGVRQVELAVLLEVQPITLARLIDQLANGDLVERRADSSDRRAYRIYLGPRARPQLAAINRISAAVQAEALQGLGTTEVALLFDALRRMQDNLAKP